MRLRIRFWIFCLLGGLGFYLPAQSQESGQTASCTASASLFLNQVRAARNMIERNGDRTLVMSATNADRLVKLHAFDAALLKQEQLTASYFPKSSIKFSVEEMSFEVGRVNEKGSETLKEDITKILKAVAQELKELSKDDGTQDSAPEVVAQLVQLRAAAKFVKEIGSSLEEQESREFFSWCLKNESWLLAPQTSIEQLIEKYAYEFVTLHGKRILDGEPEFKSFWTRSWTRVSEPVGRFWRLSKKDLPKVYRRQLLKSPVKYLIPGMIAYYIANQGSIVKVKVSDEKKDLEELISKLEKLKLEAERLSKEIPVDASGEKELEALKIYARGLTMVNAKESRKMKSQKQALTFIVQSLLANEKREASNWLKRMDGDGVSLSLGEQEEVRVLYARRFLLESVFSAYTPDVNPQVMAFDLELGPRLMGKLGGASRFISTIAEAADEIQNSMKESLKVEDEREPSSEKPARKKILDKKINTKNPLKK